MVRNIRATACSIPSLAVLCIFVLNVTTAVRPTAPVCGHRVDGNPRNDPRVHAGRPSRDRSIPADYRRSYFVDRGPCSTNNRTIVRRLSCSDGAFVNRNKRIRRDEAAGSTNRSLATFEGRGGGGGNKKKTKRIPNAVRGRNTSLRGQRSDFIGLPPRRRPDPGNLYRGILNI